MSGFIFEGKTIDEAIARAEEELDTGRDNLRIEVEEEREKGILGLKWGKKICIKVEIKEVGKEDTCDIAGTAQKASGMLNKLLMLSGLSGEVEIEETLEEILLNVKIDSDDDEALFIGRKGKNIDSFQYFLNKVAGKGKAEKKKIIVVDCAGYRAKRKNRIEKIAKKAALVVKSQKSIYKFPPMTAAERRIVHMTMKGEGLQTQSRGNGEERNVVVFPPNHTAAL